MSYPFTNWMKLGDQGVVVSVGYGPDGWSCAISIADSDGGAGAGPFRAGSFTEAIERARIEAQLRGWVTGKQV